MPPSILDENGQVDATKIHTITSNLKETTERLNPEQSATVDITLPPKGDSLGIRFTSDETYGFPLLTIAKVAPTSPLQTQIPTYGLAMQLLGNSNQFTKPRVHRTNHSQVLL